MMCKCLRRRRQYRIICSNRPNTILVAGSTNREFAEEVAKHLGVQLANIQTGKFKDGETYVKVG